MDDHHFLDGPDGSYRIRTDVSSYQYHVFLTNQQVQTQFDSDNTVKKFFDDRKVPCVVQLACSVEYGFSDISFVVSLSDYQTAIEFKLTLG
jgi:hypothetical protein